MLKPNRVLDFQPICPLSPRERVEDIETLPCFRFSANLSLLPAGGGVEDTEPQPLWDFSQFCPLSPWEWGGERAVSRRLTFRFLGFAKNLLKGRLNGCPVERLRTLKTSEANFAKTER